MIRAVLFDLDGTLVNTLGDLAAATNHALTLGGYPTHPTESFKQFAGNGNRKMMERALPENARTDKIIDKTKDEFFKYYESHPADLSFPYDGIVELINALKANNIYVCVVTNKAERATRVVLPAVFGDFRFDSVVGGSDKLPLKPQPHMAYVAMNEIGVNADECLFVGDSYTDMLTANNGGNIAVGVLWGFRDRKELEESGAQYVIEAPDQILDIIDAINNCKDYI